MTTGLLPASAADPQAAAVQLAAHLHGSSQALMDVLSAVKSRFTTAKLAQPPPVATLEQTILDLGTRFRDAVVAGQVPIQAWRQVASKTSDALLQMSREMQQLKLDDGSLARAAAAAKGAIMAAGQQKSFGDAAPAAAATGTPGWLFPVGVLGIAGLALYTYRSMKKDQKKRYGARDIQLDDDDDADGYDAVDDDDSDDDDDFGDEMQLEPPSHEPESELGGRGRRKKSKSRAGITRVKPLKRKRSLGSDDDEEDDDD